MGKSPTVSVTPAQSRRRSRSWLLLSAWIPVLLALVIIFLESSDYASSANTGSILYRIMTFVWAHIGAAKFDAIHFLLRKAGHFLGYGILGLLFFRAIRRTVPLLPRNQTVETSRQRIFRWACEAIFFTALVAAADEWHQSFLPSRTGAVHDVVLDTIGAMVLLSLVLIRYAIRPSVAEAK